MARNGSNDGAAQVCEGRKANAHLAFAEQQFEGEARWSEHWRADDANLAVSFRFDIMRGGHIHRQKSVYFVFGVR